MPLRAPPLLRLLTVAGLSVLASAAVVIRPGAPRSLPGDANPRLRWNQVPAKAASARSTPLVVGIAGGTGSGKTTLAEAIVARLGPERVLHLSHDSYYRDLSHLPLAARAATNFDAPAALDTELLVGHVERLREGAGVAVPSYDFATHTRTADWVSAVPRPVIVVEGILIFTCPQLRALLDLRIFVDTQADTRFIRRLTRDVEERGRDMHGVIAQYEATVRPMHDLHVEPTKAFADMLIPNGVNEPALDLVVGRLQAHIEQQASPTA